MGRNHALYYRSWMIDFMCAATWVPGWKRTIRSKHIICHARFYRHVPQKTIRGQLQIGCQFEMGREHSILCGNKKTIKKYSSNLEVSYCFESEFVYLAVVESELCAFQSALRKQRSSDEVCVIGD